MSGNLVNFSLTTIMCIYFGYYCVIIHNNLNINSWLSNIFNKSFYILNHRSWIEYIIDDDNDIITQSDIINNVSTIDNSNNSCQP